VAFLLQSIVRTDPELTPERIPSPFFPHKLSIGYTNPSAQVVKSINGVPVRNLDHLVETLRDSKE